MKRLMVFGVVLASLAAVRPVSAQFIVPRQGGEVIGNDSSGVISVQTPVETRIEKPVSSKPTQPSTEYVIVTGQVANPGVFEYRNGIANLADLIDQAGRLTQFSNREFYVYRHGKGFLELDFRTQANFPFQNGDILIAETPVRYYRELNNPDSKIGLYDLHEKTQIIMFNLADRPVLYSVPPTGARMPALLKLLNQSPTAMVGVDLVSPPHSREIPAHAQIAPGVIPSCSIITFDPKRIDRSTLPTLPLPVLAEPSRSIRVVSQELPATTNKPRGVTPSGLYEWKQLSGDAPRSAFHPDRAVANRSMLASKDTPPAGKSLSIDRPAREESSKIATKTPKKTKPKKRSQPQKRILSRQQTTIVIGFFVVVGLFILAYLVRKKQEQRELLPLAAKSAKHSRSMMSLYSKVMKRFSGQTAEQSELEKLEAASEAVASVAEAASSVTELTSEKSEAEPAIAEDSGGPVKGINPEVENRLVQFVNQISSSTTQSDRSLVELLVELAASQEKRERESAEPATQHSQEASPESADPASIETRSGVQPMFPMIWEQNLEQPGALQTTQTSEAQASDPASEVHAERTAHSDHPTANGPHRIPLDRVFFAVQRERGQKETTE